MTEKLIKESEGIYRYENRVFHGEISKKGIEYGEEVVTDGKNVIFRWGAEGGYCEGDLNIPIDELMNKIPWDKVPFDVLMKCDDVIVKMYYRLMNGD